jgi:protein-disulfide isomerase
LPAQGELEANAVRNADLGAAVTLKARLEELLSATPEENTRRRNTLQAALNAGESEDDTAAALGRLIEARELRAASLDATGRPDLAKAERDEIALLRNLFGGPEGSAAAGQPSGFAARIARQVSRKQLIFGAAAVVAVAAAALFLVRPWDEGSDTQPGTGTKITVLKDDHTLGNPNAPITLLEYASPSCPHCAHFAIEDMPQIKKDLIDTGKVFYIFRVFPIHAPDGAVEGIARCLPSQRYFPYMERMFRNMSQWYSGETTDVHGAIVQLAAAEGISREQADRCISNQKVVDRINEIAQDAVATYQVNYTPFFVVDGVVINVPPGEEAGKALRIRINALLTMKE